MCIRDSVLFLLNIAAYVVLWLLTALRLYLYPKRLIGDLVAVSYTHLRAHATVLDLVCRLLLEKKNHSPPDTAHKFTLNT